MITVPLTKNFDIQHILGVLTIDENELPPTPEFVFSIGYKALDLMEVDKPYNGSYNLMEVTILSDDQYIKYLQKINKLPNPLTEEDKVNLVFDYLNPKALMDKKVSLIEAFELGMKAAEKHYAT